MDDQSKPIAKTDLFENFRPRSAFFLGLAGGFLLLGTIGFFIMLAVNLAAEKTVTPVAQNQPILNNQPNAQPATAQPDFKLIRPVDNKLDNILGNKKAKITLVEYSDFECPFCARVLPTLKQLLANYGDQIRLVFRHFPLGIHPYATKAAQAAQCAAEQGKFWEYHDKLFTEQSALSGLIKAANAPSVSGRIIIPVQTQSGIQYADITEVIPTLKQYAAGLSLNMAKFNTCLDQEKTAERVAADLQEATAALPPELQGTPAIFINNKEFVAGNYPLEYFKGIIDKLLAE